MLSYLKAATAAAVILCASQANAATFVVSANAPATFSVDRLGFTFTYSAMSAVATTFLATLSAYDFSSCTLPQPQQCADYDRNRTATITLQSDTTGATRNGSISIATGPGPIGPITLAFATLSEAPITIDFTPNGATIAAIPEPATWALMLAGFGMVGYGLRRRRSSVAFA